MANLTQVELPNGTTYDIQDAQKSGVYTVIGTQTAATGAWTGDLPLPALYDGLTINYYLPYAGSGNATLDLTLSDGTTTGAVNCYLSTSRLTTQYGAGRCIVMTYYSAGSISISGTATTDDRWICDAYYDTNTQDTSTIRPYYSHPTASGNGIKQHSLFARILYKSENVSLYSTDKYSSFTLDSGTSTKTFDTTSYFDPTKIFYYANSDDTDIAAGTRLGNNTVGMSGNRVDFRYTFNEVTKSASTSSLKANMPVYMVFDLSSEDDGYYKLKSPYMTQCPNDNTALYVLVGYMEDSYRGDLWLDNPMFLFESINTGYYWLRPYTPNRHIRFTSSNAFTPQIDIPKTQDYLHITAGTNVDFAGSFGTGDKEITVNATDTTYTFADGTNSFTVTPSGGSAQTVNVTPSIADNITGSGTSGYLTKFNGTNTITNGPQLGSSTTTYLNNAGSWATPPDTKNTAGSTDTASKIYLIGATSQAANPQTYSDNEVYTTSGVLTTKSVQIGGGSCSLVYNSTTKSCDFVFS